MSKIQVIPMTMTNFKQTFPRAVLECKLSIIISQRTLSLDGKAGFTNKRFNSKLIDLSKKIQNHINVHRLFHTSVSINDSCISKFNFNLSFCPKRIRKSLWSFHNNLFYYIFYNFIWEYLCFFFGKWGAIKCRKLLNNFINCEILNIFWIFLIDFWGY